MASSIIIFALRLLLIEKTIQHFHIQTTKMPKNIELTAPIVEAVQDKKGQNITIIDLSEIQTAPTAKFIICEGRSPAQVSAIADSVRDSLLEKYGRKPYNYDGYRNSQWIVVDYGEVVVHVFIPEFRERYALEELWGDAPQTRIEEL